jgi:hypothetical protein
MPTDIRTDAAVKSGLGAAQPRDEFLSHVIARAIEAVCLLMLDSFDLETLMSIIPCCRAAGVQSHSLRDTRAMNDAAWLFELNAAGTEFPPRSRTIKPTRRLPSWFPLKLASRRCAWTLAGAACAPKYRINGMWLANTSRRSRLDGDAMPGDPFRHTSNRP